MSAARSADSTAAGEAHDPPHTGPIVAVLAFAGIVVALMQTLMVPLIPKLPELLHTSPSNAEWAITATLLAGAVSTPVLGRLGDMFGKRRILLLNLGLLVVGSVVCALSDSLIPMVVGRALQGVAMGVIPLGISIMRDELPPERLGASIALMSSSLGVGGALGLPGAAFVAQHADWHALFWASTALGVVVIGLVLAVVAESEVRSGGHFDLVGALGLSVGLLCLLLAVSKGSDWGWGSGLTLGLLAGAAIVLLLWGRFELRTTEPLVDLRTTARRQVLLTNLASVMAGFSMLAMSLVLPQLLQLPKATGYGLGQSMVVAGLCLGPSGLAMMAVAPISARLTRARGPKASLLTGMVIIAAGYALSVVFLASVWEVVTVAVVIAAGVGFAYGAMPALIMGAVPLSETASANGLNSLMRSIGTSTSSAVMGVLLAHMTMDFGGVAVPSHNGVRVSMAVAGGAALLAIVLAAFIPGRRRVLSSAAASTPASGSDSTLAGLEDRKSVV